MKIGIIGTGKSGLASIFGADFDCKAEDVITTTPTLIGEKTLAWQLDIDDIRKKKERPDASVALWMIEAPWAHPAWHSYMLSLIHLRDIEGIPPAKKFFPDATHEIVLYAMDPGEPRQALIDNFSLKSCLSPPNYASQFIEIEDQYALQRVEDVVKQIVAGKLSPDTDCVSEWKKLFGKCMYKEAFK